MQHDVFVNPAVRSRKVFPMLVVLQADLASGDRRLIAPMMLREAPPALPPNKAVPQIVFQERGYALLLTLINSIEMRQLRRPAGSVAVFRDDIARALDWLLFGI